MITYTDVEKFLQAVFGSDYGTRAIFAHSVDHPDPKKRMKHVRALTGLDNTRDCYWSVGAFPDDGLAVRREHRATEVRALVIDDVGTKISEAAVQVLGTPTAIVESSFMNFQWVYRLSRPVPIEQWDAFANGVAALIKSPKPPEGLTNAVCLFRLPMGMNCKPRRGGFPVALVELNPGAVLDVETITPIGSSKVKASSAGWAGGYIRNIKGIVTLVPNDTGYHEWIYVMWQIRKLAKDPEDGREAFREFTGRWKGGSTDDADAKWDSMHDAPTCSGQDLLADAEAANKAEYDKIINAEAGGIFDDGAIPPKVPPRGAVKFKRGKHKEILATKANAELGLEGLDIACAYDEFHHRAYIRRGAGETEKLSDKLLLLLRGELNTAYGKDFGTVHLMDAIMAQAYLNGFNPVVDMLREAEASWDGMKRLDRLGPDYFHSEDTELARRCFRKTMIAAVRRARRPGCKFDQILVLESPEGWDKSTAWAVLAGEENFSDADILGKDARAVQEELADVWVHEIADLSGLSRADVEHVKAFASRTNDRARPAYGRVLLDQPRQSIEVGTTNAESYLLSTTGNRRFWTFRLCARVETERLRTDRLQLWGEAARAESVGETPVLDEALWGEAALAQEERRVIDPWEDELANLPDTLIKGMRGVQTITNVAIHDFLGGHRGANLTGASGRRIAEIMKRHGWKRGKVKDALGEDVRGYSRRTDIARSIPASVQKNTF